MTFVMAMFVGSIAFADEPDTSTKFSGNLRLSYKNMMDTDDNPQEDILSVHYLELRVKKQVGPIGLYVNERINGGFTNTYLYEGWISYKAPGAIGLFKMGAVPQAFGIFANGLYFPKGVPYAKGWMWRYGGGARYDNKFKAGENLDVNVGASYFDRGLTENQRDTVSGRVGIDLGGDIAVKAGGSVQMATLKAEVGDDGIKIGDDSTKMGFAGDITISPKMLPVPVTVLGEFINYSLGDDDAQKGNIMMGQLDVTPISGKGILNSATLSLHFSMDSPTEGDSLTSLIAQAKLVLSKNLIVFAQVFGDTVGDNDMSNKGLRVWFMYLF